MIHLHYACSSRVTIKTACNLDVKFHLFQHWKPSSARPSHWVIRFIICVESINFETISTEIRTTKEILKQVFPLQNRIHHIRNIQTTFEISLPNAISTDTDKFSSYSSLPFLNVLYKYLQQNIYILKVFLSLCQALLKWLLWT